MPAEQTTTTTVEELTKTIAELRKQVDALDSPDLSQIRTETRSWSADPDSPELTLSAEQSATARPWRGSHKSRIARNMQSIGYQPCAAFKSLGEFVQTGIRRGTSAMESVVGDAIAKAMGLKAGEIEKTIQGMSESIGSDGGVLVLPEFSTTIFDRVYSNDLYSRTDNYTVAGNTMTFRANKETSRVNGSRHGGLRGYWVGEGGTITDSKPGFRELTLKLKKAAVVVYLTDELLEDAPALGQYVARKAAEEFEFLLGDAIFNGVGAGQPLGVLNSPALLSVAKESGQAASTFVYENANKMWARMFAPSRDNAVWYINQDVEPQLDVMALNVGTGGAPVFLPQGGAAVAPFRTLKGRPIQETEFNATLGTRGDVLLADLSQYVTISKGGIAQAVSMHVEFLTAQTALRFTIRVDGQTWENSPITPYQGTNTQSSFVVLDTRD